MISGSKFQSILIGETGATDVFLCIHGETLSLIQRWIHLYNFFRKKKTNFFYWSKRKNQGLLVMRRVCNRNSIDVSEITDAMLHGYPAHDESSSTFVRFCACTRVPMTGEQNLSAIHWNRGEKFWDSSPTRVSRVLRPTEEGGHFHFHRDLQNSTRNYRTKNNRILSIAKDVPSDSDDPYDRWTGRGR